MLIKCGTLIDGSGARPVTGGAILVEGTTIAAVGSADQIKAPPDAPVVDLSAYTVIPGMIDCHDHLQFDTGDEEAMSREPLGWLMMRAAKNARKLLRAGITTMRDVGAKGFGDVEIKRAIEAGLVPGPRLLVSGHFVVRTGGHAWYLGEQADGPDGVRAAVRRQVRGGADLVKFMITGGIATRGMDPVGATYGREEIWAAVDEAHREGKKAAAHGYGGPAVLHAVEAGLDSLEHAAMCSTAELEAMANKGTYLVCTYGVMEHVVATPGIPEFFRERRWPGQEQEGAPGAQLRRGQGRPDPDRAGWIWPQTGRAGAEPRVLRLPRRAPAIPLRSEQGEATAGGGWVR